MALTTDPFVTIADRSTGQSVSFTDVLTALVAGLPFIGAPISEAEIAASTAAKAFLTGLQQTPRLIKANFPTRQGVSLFIRYFSINMYNAQ